MDELELYQPDELDLLKFKDHQIQNFVTTHWREVVRELIFLKSTIQTVETWASEIRHEDHPNRAFVAGYNLAQEEILWLLGIDLADLG
jgi:hypothetical protein